MGVDTRCVRLIFKRKTVAMKYVGLTIMYLATTACILASLNFLPPHRRLIFVALGVMAAQAALAASCLALSNRNIWRIAIALLLLVISYTLFFSVRIRHRETAVPVVSLEELDRAVEDWRRDKQSPDSK